MPISKCLDVLSGPGSSMGWLSAEIGKKVSSGHSLSKAMSDYPQIFSPVVIGQIQAGQDSGMLDKCLKRLCFMLERNLKQIRKLQATLTYPAVLFSFSMLVVVFFVLFVLPALTPMFTTLKIQLPWPTRVLLMLRTAMVPAVAVLAILILLGGYAKRPLRRWLDAHPEQKIQLALIPLQMPVVGKVYHNYLTATILQAMATLLDNGLTLTATLNRATSVASNAALAQRLVLTRKSLESGETLSRALKQHQVFPRAALMILGAAEEASNLADTFQRLSNFYDEEVEASLDAASALAEPLIMAVMGCISGFIAIAAVLPTLEMLKNF